MFMTF